MYNLRSMTSKFQARVPYFILVLLIFLADRWTKSWIVSRFNLNESVPVIDGLLDITYVRNTGVAFGIFSSLSSPSKSLLLSAFTGVAVVMVIIYSLRSPVANRLLQVALALILGGALGNLFDRLSYGYVIDFLELYAGEYRWPAFNVADSAITTGVCLLILEIIRNETSGRA
jgi:signal peptidase II